MQHTYSVTESECYSTSFAFVCTRNLCKTWNLILCNFLCKRCCVYELRVHRSEAGDYLSAPASTVSSSDCPNAILVTLIQELSADIIACDRYSTFCRPINGE